MAVAAAAVLLGAQMAALDASLMSSAVGYTLPQLMELAGLAVAIAIQKQYPRSDFPRVLVVAGPGNNGGDGLVAARHLHLFGYTPSVVYPKRPSRPESAELFDSLIKQLAAHHVPVHDAMPMPAAVLADYDLLVDAVFGFSFSGALRAPFDDVVKTMALVSDRRNRSSSAASIARVGAGGEAEVDPRGSSAHGIPVVAVDVPSGWDVDRGDIHGTGLRPAMLVSLTGAFGCSLGASRVISASRSKSSAHTPILQRALSAILLATSNLSRAPEHDSMLLRPSFLFAPAACSTQAVLSVFRRASPLARRPIRTTVGVAAGSLRLLLLVPHWRNASTNIKTQAISVLLTDLGSPTGGDYCAPSSAL
jgi:hydroxyethylthiazole kinase-like uncharacterized protein yjeF